MNARPEYCFNVKLIQVQSTVSLTYKRLLESLIPRKTSNTQAIVWLATLWHIGMSTSRASCLASTCWGQMYLLDSD